MCYFYSEIEKCQKLFNYLKDIALSSFQIILELWRERVTVLV